MKINLTINGINKEFDSSPGDSLLKTLRAEGYFGR